MSMVVLSRSKLRRQSQSLISPVLSCFRLSGAKTLADPSPTEEPRDRFPRSSEPPFQSPKYWVKEKDRYLRQLLIKDIEAVTDRPLIVYFSQLDQEIGHTDPDDLSEMLLGVTATEGDLFIQTPGGNVDATEKIISLLKHRLTGGYRVIVPSWAKSAGTIIALSADKIVLGVNSELGPIDPQFRTPGGNIPCELIAADPAQPYHIRQMADLTVQRNRQLATDLLKRGMMKGKSDQDIQEAIAKISTSNSYKSHGAVIDQDEASVLGLSVEYLNHDDELWKRLWLLYCMYDYDVKIHNFGKVFEGRVYSLARPKA